MISIMTTHLGQKKIRVVREMQSPCFKSIRDVHNNSVGEVRKLVPNLSNKEKYVLH